jgi:hypothetical protein
MEENRRRNGESKTNPRRYAKREMRPCVCEQTIWQCTGQAGATKGWSTGTDQSPMECEVGWMDKERMKDESTGGYHPRLRGFWNNMDRSRCVMI